MISATSSIVSGSRVGGLSTIGLPEAMAGASLCRARLSGKLNGEMPAIGPIGNRRVDAEASLRGGHQIERDHSPSMRSRLLGGHLEREAPRRPQRVRRGSACPASCAIMRAMSSCRASMSVGAGVVSDVHTFVASAWRASPRSALRPRRWHRRRSRSVANDVTPTSESSL